MNLATLKETAVTQKPAAHGLPVLDAAFKSELHDFLVHETLGFSFSGEGEHLYLLIRKCGLNTNDIVQELQRAFEVSSADVGLCGQKDKHGITEQWFSVRTNQQAECAGLPLELALRPLCHSAFLDCDTLADRKEKGESDDNYRGLERGGFVVVDQQRHLKKLRHGAHKNNWFSLTLRHCFALSKTEEPVALEEVRAKVDERLNRIRQQGFANYFGEQRFGFAQQNLDKALRHFSDTRRKMSRHQRSMAISAARSALFNRVCAQRITNATWNRILPGELVQLNNSASYFKAELHDEELQLRADTLDVHPTGPLWGRGQVEVGADCAKLEHSILSEYEPLCKGLEKVGLDQRRRALRAVVESLNWSWSDPTTLHLQFVLSQGVYATSLLAELAQLSTTGNVGVGANANVNP